MYFCARSDRIPVHVFESTQEPVVLADGVDLILWRDQDHGAGLYRHYYGPSRTPNVRFAELYSYVVHLDVRRMRLVRARGRIQAFAVRRRDRQGVVGGSPTR